MLRQSGSIETFKASFEGRLQALSQAHDLLTRSNWEGAELATVTARALKPFDRGNPSPITIDGPNIVLIPRAALVLSMTVHELATNAAKYGALSTATGRLTVGWRVEAHNGGERLVLTWRERGGPLVKPPAKRGFGSSLIERGVGYELDAEVKLDYAPEGLDCEIRLPWPIASDDVSEGDLAMAA